VNKGEADTPSKIRLAGITPNLAKNRLMPACSRIGRFEAQSNGEVLYFRLAAEYGILPLIQKSVATSARGERIGR
jgi:hypothetical protein